MTQSKTEVVVQSHSQGLRQTKKAVSTFDSIYEKQHVRGVARNISQMSGISDKGISDEKEQATVSKQKERINTEASTLSKVKVLVKRLQSINASLWIVQSSDRSIILEDINSKVDRLQRSKQLPAGLAKPLAVLKNEIRSNIDLVASKPKVPVANLDLSPALSKLQATLEDKIESCNLHLTLIAEGKTIKENLIDRALTEGQAVAETAAASDKSKLVLRPGKTSTYVSDISIIPITKSIINITKLQRSLKVSNLSGYPLIHGQRVIGFKPGPVADNKKLLDAVLVKFKEKTGKTLMLVTEYGCRYNGIIWYWIADQATINQLIASSSGQSFIVKQWGFSI